ncbi:dihydroxyacetone kinase subunit DhaK [Clostridium baratii]|uniref:dihydroxyacetone kinase subunit DhaK n=1 Tax=Clostridium baratii TaxID=1561 RepID=UPI0009A340F1|nr:dihydroxyacetone kinase subunit DhaK [Clostridium baratii]OPF51232.1 dihydroxyacetone kinase [Clostridium baratii]OPF55691.1 dihydroxyacetone kinase subunit DhaK [Clostridium baratii]OPF56929.1 dihydroxyacetone kinase subunit DhaK [Clostridium baratii]OPF59928.1 dihydroxyacetone kinase subunit DhaK [Clostridium baratii]
MKKLINDPNNVLEDMIEGMCYAHENDLKRVEGFDVLVRKNPKTSGKVALVSGGGSGHEPAHAGFIGEGMLDAAVCGAVFTSPTPDQVYKAIQEVNTGEGVLLIIKNYTGDVMNFEMAQDMAEMEGINVKSVVVNDDVAVEDSLYTAGRRGIAGTIFVHKIAGAKAEEGASLDEVADVANKVIKNVRSMGMALTSCIVPAAGKPNFTLEDDEVEIGIGIHGEPGTHREKISSANNIASELVNKIMDDINLECDDEVAVMVNGLSGTPLMELYIVNKKVREILEDKGIKVYKTFVGEYMTSLEMSGCSVSILKLDDELKELLDRKADTPALKVF